MIKLNIKPGDQDKFLYIDYIIAFNVLLMLTLDYVLIFGFLHVIFLHVIVSCICTVFEAFDRL